MNQLRMLRTHDFITVGIYTALYFVVAFVVSMIGYIPILMVVLTAIIALFTSIPFILFLSKVKRFGMITISAMISGLLLSLTVVGFYPLLLATICGFIADLVFNLGKQTKLYYVLTNAIFSLWLVGFHMPIFTDPEHYFAYTREHNGASYADQLVQLFPSWILIPLFIMTFIAGVIGALIGVKLLNKHFKQAGI